MMGHEILTKFVGTQFSQFGCPATERKKVIVNFCRIDTQKNLPLLIDAFSDFSKEHGEYELVIYGDGPEKKNIQDFLQICGQNSTNMWFLHCLYFAVSTREFIQPLAYWAKYPIFIYVVAVIQLVVFSEMITGIKRYISKFKIRNIMVRKK